MYPDNLNSTMAPSEAAQSKPCLRRLENGLIDVTPTGDYIAITERNSTESPLLRLPAEIRNIIFEYVVSGHTIRMISEWGKSCWPIAKRRRFSLARVSRQTYNETALLTYTGNTLLFMYPDGIEILTTPSSSLNRMLIRNIGVIGSGTGIWPEPWVIPLLNTYFPYLTKMDIQPVGQLNAEARSFIESLGGTVHVHIREVTDHEDWLEMWMRCAD
ncbi:hypothetical protein HBI81_129500 [Parastagonospora nodorum]|nr:hypothetical protein HBH51_128930 [Parastagonospora nodorum]KAH4259461.1 hypothetical protein HBI03_136350 [Parastagonospora nodorum]KAH4281812.1 hypothetical protein HBI04_043620 [Parastagonospora nodorum]KAH5034375.1 hypothetical protein HBI75_096330 [Parastagonospora nodorum]KAH5335863.1 hypothetical protein HBI50_032170 [Parastagonospora nodorum]